MASERNLFLTYLAQTSASPLLLEIERAEGVNLYGPNGEKYIDLISGIGVSNVGHRHPEVLKAINAQLDKYLHVMVYGEVVQSPQVRLAEALVKTLPAGLNNVYLVNSGSEAVEGAIKLAKRYTRRPEIISCLNAYHGSTAGALSAGGSEALKQAFRPLLPGFRHIPFGDPQFITEITEQTAAVLIETVQGEAGVRTADADYFKELRRRCNQTGTLLIADEIQCGMGRTGTLWAFEQFGFVPDILVSAKGLGGGMPIGAFIANKEVMQCLTESPVLGHITTFGGHPVSAAAALATLQIIQSGNLLQELAPKAACFAELLQHPEIIELRRCGFLMALQFQSFKRIQAIIAAALRMGLLTDWFLFCDDALRIAPPLTISYPEIEEACTILLSAIEETAV